MFPDSQVFRYGVSLLGVVAGAFRLEDWFGPAFAHAVGLYALDLCQITSQVVCF